jgi:hypothetical protein
VRSVLCAFAAQPTGGPCPVCMILGKQSLHQLKRRNERSRARVDESAGGQASFDGRHLSVPQLGAQEVVARLNAARLEIQTLGTENTQLFALVQQRSRELMSSKKLLQEEMARHQGGHELLDLVDRVYAQGKSEELLVVRSPWGAANVVGPP